MFLSNYQSYAQTTTLKCYKAQALQQTNQANKAKKILKPLWLSGENQPDTCTPAFETWLAEHPNKDDLIWQRFELTLKKYNFGVAKYLITIMSDKNANEANAILKLYDNPNLISSSNYLKTNPSAEVISYGIYRLARRNPYNAIKIYERLSKQYQFNDKQKQRIFQAIAIKFAMRKNKASVTWFNKIVGYDLDPVYKEWMIISALYHQDWKLVKKSIQAMPEKERNQDKWRYWHARALDKLNEKKPAKELLLELAKSRSYYSFLANQYLQQDINVFNQPIILSDAEVITIQNLPAYKRAKSLFDLNQKHEARLELYFLMKQLDLRNQYILTKLVASWGWHAQVLRLSYRAKYQDDVDLRFPLAFQELILQNAQERKVEPALVYAIMRQESYFMENAHSPAGALGLMQLMPDTAYKTAKQYNLKYTGKEILLDGDTNIIFGTAHLNRLKKEFQNHPVLMIAAYNAGKRAVNRWIRQQNGRTVAVDVWVETVPYRETRNYLKRVIAGYVIYQYRLGKTPSLDILMKQIKG